MAAAWYRWHDDDLLLECYLRPRAKSDQVLGLHDGRLHLQVQAPPVDDKANAALCAMLARAFGVGRSRCRLQSGARGRRKTVAIHKPADQPEWFRRLQQT